MVHFVDKAGNEWNSGMFAKGSLNWGYGDCLFLIKIEDDKLTTWDQSRKHFYKSETDIFNNILFESISENEYNDLIKRITNEF